MKGKYEFTLSDQGFFLEINWAKATHFHCEGQTFSFVCVKTFLYWYIIPFQALTYQSLLPVGMGVAVSLWLCDVIQLWSSEFLERFVMIVISFLTINLIVNLVISGRKRLLSSVSSHQLSRSPSLPSCASILEKNQANDSIDGLHQCYDLVVVMLLPLKTFRTLKVVML